MNELSVVEVFPQEEMKSCIFQIGSAVFVALLAPVSFGSTTKYVLNHFLY